MKTQNIHSPGFPEPSLAEEPGGLQSMGGKRVRPGSATKQQAPPPLFHKDLTWISGRIGVLPAGAVFSVLAELSHTY